MNLRISLSIMNHFLDIKSRAGFECVCEMVPALEMGVDL